MRRHFVEIAFFSAMCGLWVGLGIYHDGWLPWLCAAINGIVACAGIALAPVIVRERAQEGEG